MACFSHDTRSAAVQPSLLHQANNRQTCYRFFNFCLGRFTPGPKFIKGKMTYYPPISTILQNFSRIAQTVYKICVTKVFFHFLAYGLNPGPKFTKRGDDLPDF